MLGSTNPKVCVSSRTFEVRFIAALAPAITFGSRFLDGTNGQFGVLEMIMSTSVSGMIFSSTAGQPLSILGATGPFLAYTLVVYDLAIAVDVELRGPKKKSKTFGPMPFQCHRR